MSDEKYDSGLISDALGKAIDYRTRGKQVTEGIVTAVDMSDFTCSVKCSDNLFTGVPLSVLVSTQGSILIKPEIDSHCLILFRDGSIQRPQLLMVDQIDKLYVTCNEIIINGGGDGGIVLANNLVTRMNLIENAYNDLVSKFNAHVHSGVTTGPGSSGPTPTPETTVLIDTTANDIQSSTIIQ